MVINVRFLWFRFIFTHWDNIGTTCQSVFVGLKNYTGIHLLVTALKPRRFCFIDRLNFWSINFYGNWTEEEDKTVKAIHDEQHRVWNKWCS